MYKTLRAEIKRHFYKTPRSISVRLTVKIYSIAIDTGLNKETDDKETTKDEKISHNTLSKNRDSVLTNFKTVSQVNYNANGKGSSSNVSLLQPIQSKKPMGI